MSSQRKLGIFYILTLLIAASFLAAGCSVFNSIFGGGGAVMQYKLPADGQLQYSMTNDIDQSMQVMGQSMEITTNLGAYFSVASKGMSGKDLDLGIKIDSMNIKVGTPRGDVSPDLSSVNGKEFEMKITPAGKQVGLIGADEIKYSMGQGGESSIASSFQSVMPVLADHPVEIGDSWTSTDTVMVSQMGSNLMFVYVTTDTLLGYEEVMGMKCAKISGGVTGALSGTGRRGGMSMSFEGKVTGSEQWLFSPEKGLLVKVESTKNIDGSIAASGMQSMTIPMNMTVKAKTELVK